MTNNTSTVPGSETQSGTTPQGETPQSSANGEMPGTTTPPASIDDALKEIESLKAALKKSNTEGASHRHKAKELDDLKAKIEADSLTETQKLQKKIDELTTQNATLTTAQQERIVNYEVRLQAAQLGIANPSVAAKLLNWNEIQYDDEGLPTNIDTLLKALLKAEPYLGPQQGGKQQASVGATNPGRTASTTNSGQLSWDIITKMTPAEYNSRRGEIMQWMQSAPMRR